MYLCETFHHNRPQLGAFIALPKDDTVPGKNSAYRDVM